MQLAKLFTNGRSQAVRLPKNCRFSGQDVYVHKFEGLVVLFPKKNPWTSLIKSLDKFSEDFLDDRGQPSEQQTRVSL